ncbi:MAG: flagellar assembly protein FliX [Rhodospirillaceae bacterium]|nr:flagellar assembly protein FliX [Rhodospirillaceae bacterium]
MSIKITGPGGTKSPSGPKRTKGAAASGGSSFADQLKAASGVSGAEGVTGSGIVEKSQVEGVDAILAMQESGDGGEERARKQAAAYGIELLDKLNELQDGLLLGAIPKDKLMEIAHKIRSERGRVDDAQLNDILDEIELRAEVEIAKYTR